MNNLQYKIPPRTDTFIISSVNPKGYCTLYDDSLFLFCGFRNDRFKGLYWDGEDFILLYKRYENGHLKWPRTSSEARLLKRRELANLLKGLNPFPTPNVHKAKPGNLY
ncbi:IS66 family insertion sequence element accessory protein TnpB [Limosilactobacillus reuteri]|uniref:IS66 family insertion sequence element accessory protein TnpB n=1 Tax=Limosilactobacillus reuteri TaxID=1598 RepID=UPI0039853CD4|nr:IS66 family insertion sequence element accessory protein TnpB [Limosilactobacillus reuteri]MCC4515897.1 IS66 family insertion sequence element accessory protein TnpB [Limosilactobacillus reuteri]MCC4516772.1 IS66 family insertion sequence element accessory protein TnpB [Limosilactobacillus reuteri]